MLGIDDKQNITDMNCGNAHKITPVSLTVTFTCTE